MKQFCEKVKPALEAVAQARLGLSGYMKPEKEGCEAAHAAAMREIIGLLQAVSDEARSAECLSAEDTEFVCAAMDLLAEYLTDSHSIRLPSLETKLIARATRLYRPGWA